VNTHHNLIDDRMKQTALFLYEMLCIKEGIFEFCHDQNFLIRSQVDEIIAFLACEWSYVCSMLYIAYCRFHACPVHFIAFDAYVVPVICCTQCTIFILIIIEFNFSLEV